jgi:hypothetical protein
MDVHEALAHRIARVIDGAAEREPHSAGGKWVADGTGVGAERASRSSLGTTSVSP